MKRYFLVVILLLSCLLTSLLGTAPAIAYADDFIYTNVLEDLQTDENFNKSNYPVKSDDYSLQVIQNYLIIVVHLLRQQIYHILNLFHCQRY